MHSLQGRPIARKAQCAGGIGYWKKQRPLCNIGDKGSRFALPEREQTFNMYRLHEGTENCECIMSNDTVVRTTQIWGFNGTR